MLIQGAKADAPTVVTHLTWVAERLSALETLTAASVKEVIFDYATEVGRSAVLWPMRVALSGKEKSPDPFTLCELLGKELVLERIAAALRVL